MNENAGLRQLTKEEWIDALWSGEYRQGRDRLHGEDGAYCCLGVLAHLAGVEWSSGRCVIWRGDHCVWSLPPSFYEAIGLPWLSDRAHELANLNDHEQRTFREIGEYLKELPF